MAMIADLEARIRGVAETLDGVIGVALTFLPTGESVFVNADAVFPTASVIKVAIIGDLFTQAAEGRLSLEAPVTVTDEAMVAGSGVLALLTPGLTLPLRDAAMLTIAVSDNTASNLCLAAVGGPSVVNDRMRGAWGMTATTIHRPIQFFLGPDDPPHTATGTPRDLLRLLTLLARGKVHSPEVSEQTLRLMAEVRDTEMLPRYLETNPYAEELSAVRPPFVVRHKTGATTGVRNDAGLITRASLDGPGETLAICVYTKNVRDTRWTAANEGSEAAAQVGRLACKHFFREE